MAAAAHLGHDAGLPGRAKKKTADDLDDLYDSGRTHNPYLARILLARMINVSVSGCNMRPWDVDQIDEIWLDVFRAMAQHGPARYEADRRVQAARARWLAKHPTYNK